MAIVRSPAPAAPTEEQLPYGPEFQKGLIKLLCDDPAFATSICPHLKPKYFSAPPLAWAYAAIEQYREQYGATPTTLAMMDIARNAKSAEAPVYVSLIDSIRQTQLRDEAWVRNETIDFVRRGFFATAVIEASQLFNSGKFSESYDGMMQRMDELRLIQVDQPDRSMFFEELPQRQAARLGSDPTLDSIGTGLRCLDHTLGGGLSLGELGVWIAYAKGGKSTLLTGLGVASARSCARNTLHCVFEGSRAQVEARYDTAFAREQYSEVKRGNLTDAAYRNLLEEYKYLRGKLIVRGYTDRWDYSVMDIDEELRDLKSRYGYKPEMLIVDYADLLGGRAKTYQNETAKQQAAYRDLKTLANRGYAIWTASQARRPEKGDEDAKHLIQSSAIADAYAKVRVADFLGSLNQTRTERQGNVMRLYSELYRDNSAEVVYTVRCDFSQMRIWEDPTLPPPQTSAASPATNSLGYPTRTHAPV